MANSSADSTTRFPAFASFGELLKYLRRRARMTQGELSIAVGYSISQISRLEHNERFPDQATLLAVFVPALRLEHEPELVARLLELAKPPFSEAGSSEPTVAMPGGQQTDPDPKPLATLPLHNLPHRLTSFVGRVAEIATLRQRIVSTRLVTLTGAGGMGKTSLALETGRLAHFRDGVWLVELAALQEAALVTKTMAALFALPEVPDRTPLEVLTTYLQPKHLLLLLDNCEHVIATCAAAVERLLRACPHLHILATSREALGVEGELEWVVTALRTPELSTGGHQPIQADEIKDYEAVHLFLHRAQTSKPDFVLSEQNAPAIAQICSQLDGMPLALELAAARLKGLTVQEVAVRLQDRFALLSGGRRTALLRHQTLRAAMDWSYDLLSEPEQRLLRQLALFAGGWTLDAAEAMAVDNQARAQTLTLLLQLVSKSLVVADERTGATRYRMLETIRQYAAEKLHAAGEEPVARQRHYAVYLQLFRTGDSHLRGPEVATWLARLEPEQDNLRAALQWALNQARYVDAAWLMVIALWFWHRHGYWSEFGSWLAKLLPHRHELPPDLRLTVLLSLYSVPALEEYKPVERYTDEVIALLEVCSDKLFHASAWHFIAVYSTDFSQAAAAWDRSIAFARAAPAAPSPGVEFGIPSDRDFVLGHALWSYARRLMERGEFARTAALCEEGLTLFQARGNRYESANGLGTLGHLALLQGDLVQANTLLQEAVTIAATVNYQEMLGVLQPILALVTLYRGNVAEAHRLLDESLRLCLELNSKDYLAYVCTYLAEVALWEGELDQAEEWLAQSLGYYADVRLITTFQIKRLWVAARLATVQQRYQRAATLFGVADQVHSQIQFAIAGPQRALADAALATVRAALDAASFAEAFATGQQLSLDKALTTILMPSHVVGTLTASGRK